jgi:2-pyrone-4,6-dicarboxylate lactonase
MMPPPPCLPRRDVTRPKVRRPEWLVWGGDWPHLRVEGEMPDAGHLFELFQVWTPDQSAQQRILVANPAKLCGFP